MASAPSICAANSRILAASALSKPSIFDTRSTCSTVSDFLRLDGATSFACPVSSFIFFGVGASFASSFSAAAAAAAGVVFPVIFFLDALRPLSVLAVSAAGGGGSGAAGCGAAGAAASCPPGVLDLALPLALAFALDFAFAAGLAGGTTCSGGATTGVWFSVIGVAVMYPSLLRLPLL